MRIGLEEFLAFLHQHSARRKKELLSFFRMSTILPHYFLILQSASRRVHCMHTGKEAVRKILYMTPWHWGFSFRWYIGTREIMVSK